MLSALAFLVVLEVLALIGLPLAARALGRLPGAGLGFARVLAWLLLAWLVFALGSIGLPHGLPLVLACVAALGALALVLHRRRPAAETPDPFRRRLLIASEALFAVAFLVFAFIGSYASDVWGTEKPMDMMLMNATLNSPDFPPHDPWLSGFDVNYYYLGQHMLALPIRLTGLEPTVGYNLALAALVALTLSTAFTLAATLAEAGRRQGLAIRRPLLAGALAAILLGLMGNLRGGWQAIQADDKAAFDWFGASRVIPDTINEFPYFSFSLGDLHAHVVAIPLTLLALAFVVSAGVHGPPRLRGNRAGMWETFCAALAIAWLYAVNSWSWPVMVATLALAVAVWLAGAERGHVRAAIGWTAGVVVLGVVLIAPFILSFDPNARGFALTSADQRESFGAFLRHHLVIEGTLLWLLAGPLLGLLLAYRYRLRVAVWGLGLLALVLPLLGGANLAGAAVVAILAAGALAGALARHSPPVVRLLWALSVAGLACVLASEVAVVRDEFAGGELERMNTVFKLGYQAWLLLAVFGAVALASAREWLPRALPRFAWRLGAAVLIVVSLGYTVIGTYARRGAFEGERNLDGRMWLARQAPGDVEAIDWVREETDGDAVILEAVGDDYSAFGNARVSSYTGRPTVVGWIGHELQWGHGESLLTRKADVEAMYEATDPAALAPLLERYGIEYAIFGPLERTTYGQARALRAAGERVFSERGTDVYRFD